ncbi:MAG: hypothetical protein ACP5E4_01785 [Candidatus Aenigmatarchaeota archaeon]
MGALSCQYTDYPNEPVLEPPSSPQEEGRDTNKMIYAAVGLVVLAVVLIVFLFSGGESDVGKRYGNGECDFEENCHEHPDDCGCAGGKDCIKFDGDWVCAKIGEGSETTSGQEGENKKQASLLGNKKCDAGENCDDNPLECPCGEGEYCSKSVKACITPFCGDGDCGEGEYPDTCCADCGCVEGGCEICNVVTQVCEVPVPDIDDATAIQFIEEYFMADGKIVQSVELSGYVCAGKAPAVSAVLFLEGEENPIDVQVTESGEVDYYLTY